MNIAASGLLCDFLLRLDREGAQARLVVEVVVE